MKKTVITLAALICANIFCACEKDEVLQKKDILPSNGQNIVKTSTNYPLVLTEDEAPFEYAIYTEDLNLFFSHATTIYEEQENVRYFILSSTENLVKYAVITTSSPYYNSNIFTDGSNNIFVNIDNWDENNVTCIGFPKITTTNERKFERWLDKQLSKGRKVTVEFDATTSQWKGVSVRQPR